MDVKNIITGRNVRTVFQPIIDLDAGAVVAFEALSRGPAGEYERPDDLFAAAREQGLLAELDALCGSVAITNAVTAGIAAPLAVFVNVEPEVLDSETLDHLIAIAESAPGGLQVVLEITERAISARPAELLQCVRRLRAAGWRIALDDVGADDMSLAFMPLLHPDVIKLDMKLVQERPGAAVAGIMNAVNAYAERSGAVLLAEGIENEQHLEIARALGATLGQGWKFGRPSAEVTGFSETAALKLPEPVRAPSLVDSSPFRCLPSGAGLRRSTKPLLIELSKHLEREALRYGSTCLVVATFQFAQHFTRLTSARYAHLAAEVGFVAAVGAGMGPEPVQGVRGADLSPGDELVGEWDIVVLAPHFSAALLARDLGDNGPDRDRRFEFFLTYNRDIVCAAAEALMSRVLPSAPSATSPRPSPELQTDQRSELRVLDEPVAVDEGAARQARSTPVAADLANLSDLDVRHSFSGKIA